MAALLSGLFGRLGKSSEVRIASDTSYSEISDFPSVLIGGFSNRWAVKTMSQMPFAFEERNFVRLIQERDGDKRSWKLLNWALMEKRMKTLR